MRYIFILLFFCQLSFGQLFNYTSNYGIENYVDVQPTPEITDYSELVLSTFGNDVLAYWAMDEASGSKVIDISGNNEDADYIGTYYHNQDSIFGKPSTRLEPALVNFYSTRMRDSINWQEGYFSMWVKAVRPAIWDSLSITTLFYIATTPATANRMTFWSTSSGTLSFSHVGNSILDQKTTLGNPGGDRWVNIGYRWSNTSDTVAIFYNGVKTRVVLTTLGISSGNLDSTYSTAFGSASLRMRSYGSNVYMLRRAPSDSEIYSTLSPFLSGMVVFEGDSRADDNFYGDFTRKGVELGLSAVETSDFTWGGRGFWNPSVSGDDIADLVARAADTDSRMVFGGSNYLIVWIGVNDYLKTANEIYQALKSYCQSRQSSGWSKVFVCTEINSSRAGWSTKYLQLNDSIRTNYAQFSDGYIDFGGLTEMQTPTNLTYFYADGLHVNPTGRIVLRNKLAADLETILEP